MRIAIPLLALALVSLSVPHSGAQAPPAGGPDPGVAPVRQIDREEVRVTRVELAAHAVRAVHTHDDVSFHLFIPITGRLELTAGSNKPVEVDPGQAFFMKKSTPHGFRNLGDSPAMVMEVFVKPDAASGGKN